MPRVKCSMCDSTITNPDFKFIWCQEGFEHIDIGPYCPDCFVKIKICSGCQRPTHKDETRHLGGGRHYCSDCLQDLEVCGECGLEAPIHATIEGKKWCATCYQKSFKKCNHCNKDKTKESFVTDKLTMAKNAGLFSDLGDNICESCFQNERGKYDEVPVQECKHCSVLYGLSSDSNKNYCPSCYESFNACGECGARHPKVENYAKSGNNHEISLCGKCLGKTYKLCGGCGKVSASTSVHRGSRGSYILCSHCEESGDYGECSMCFEITSLREGACRKCYNTYSGNKCFCGATKDVSGKCRVCDYGEGRVYDYSFKPQLVFHTTKKDKKTCETNFFGFENEMSFGSNGDMDRQIKKVYKTFGPEIITAKSDSSIEGPGCEFVTQPMTLRFFNKMDLSVLFSGRNRESNSCGLHIHVDRRTFDNSMHIMKVTKFIQEDSEFSDKIHGRTAGSYNENFRGKTSRAVMEDKKKDSEENERRNRVNLTNNKTIEFRMFLGADTEFKLRYRAEYLHALIEWTRNIGLSQVTPDNFKVFVDKKNKFYPNLYRFLAG